MSVTKKKVVAMLLAGGQGSRLGVLTTLRAKPAVPYGGKYKIIDFPLSNCIHSGIDTVGVLTQYQPLELNAYIGTGASWDMDSNTGGAFVLPPYVKGEKGEWYSGTANAIFQNFYFIEQYDPDLIMVLSGDHIYKMDYSLMINFHEKKDADATIAVIRVPESEAHRFGIMDADDEMRIVDFEEKPTHPKNNMASMGVYVFNWKKVKEYLIKDNADPDSSNDFGKNIIPTMLANGEKLYAYPFEGYWKDVGTIESLWEANMELLSPSPSINLHDRAWRIFSRNPNQPPQYVDNGAKVTTSFISEGCYISGEVQGSILFPGVIIGKGAKVEGSIIMQNTVIGENCRINRSIIDEDTTVGDECVIGGSINITVIGHEAKIKDGVAIADGGSIQPLAVVEK